MLSHYTGGLHTIPFKPRVHYIDTETIRQDVQSMSPMDNIVNYYVSCRTQGKSHTFKQLLNTLHSVHSNNTMFTYFKPKITLYSRRLLK